MMKVPSGRVFTELDLTIFRLMVECGFIKQQKEPVTLKSGIPSHVYVFGREDITDHPDLEWLIGRKIALVVQENSSPTGGQPCLIGIPTAGTAIAQAASMVSYAEKIFINGHYICHRVMKEALKSHGTHPAWVNGSPQPSHDYWDVDNVVTDGASKIETRKRLAESGYPVQQMRSLIFVDRQQGGVQLMEKQGITGIVVVYYLLDLTFAFGELGFWPKEMVKAVEEEIKAHQLL
jgi:orotate phosphoribosyltransferase